MMAIVVQSILVLGITFVASAVPQGKSASFLAGEAAAINTVLNGQQGIGSGVSVGNGNVQSQIEILPGIIIGTSTVQPSNPTATNFEQNQVGATDINNSGKSQVCYGVPSPGECRGAFPRFFYNSSLDQCDCFLYGGCGEEEIQSSWVTYEECFTTCNPENAQEGPRCKLLPKQDIVTFTRPNPEILPTPDTSHLSDTDLIDAFLG